ncbi:MAG: hypothetical protein KDC05_00215 [Bacteroidales bacterium]|nr:hypothetical protein [Bacteroidales bacterium]
MKDSFTFFNDQILFTGNENTESHDDMKEDGDNTDWCSENAKPDKRIINNIISYSRALSVMRTKRAGTINLLMN